MCSVCDLWKHLPPAGSGQMSAIYTLLLQVAQTFLFSWGIVAFEDVYYASFARSVPAASVYGFSVNYVRSLSTLF